MTGLALGTVGLGMKYGFCLSATYDETSRRNESLKIIRKAYDEGIRFFDTAPTYGEAETLIGRALQGIRAAITALLQSIFN